ncbi:hypothetical protein ACVWYG_001410 [Pedobacter sp. UYEF25]
MKKIFLIFVPIFILSACTKDLTSLNVDPKNPLNVPSSALFTNAQRSLSNVLTSSNVNSNIFRLVEQQWQETTYTDESNYDFTTRPIPDNLWNVLYSVVIKNFDETKKKVAQDVADPAVLKNDIAITDIMQVYAFYYLVTTYGDIPYSQALDITNTFPKYDDAKTVYYDLLTRLDADIAALNPAAGSFSGADIIYGGDVTSWKKFANTLKLKMGITIADSDPTKAKTVVESAAPNAFTSAADNALFRYQSSPPNTNPIWVDLVQSGRKDFVGASTLVDKLKSLADPRLPLYLTVDGAGGYSGGTPGESSAYATFSKPAVALTAPDYPSLLLSYSETELNLAEAVERGFSVGGTAIGHYNAGVTASIKYWGGSDANATIYLATPGANYLTAAATYKEKIGIQKWLALYNRGWDAWIEQRRLDFPKLLPPASAQSGFPVRLRYPINEQNINTSNYKAAATAIGGDKVETKLFFDKF